MISLSRNLLQRPLSWSAAGALALCLAAGVVLAAGQENPSAPTKQGAPQTAAPPGAKVDPFDLAFQAAPEPAKEKTPAPAPKAEEKQPAPAPRKQSDVEKVIDFKVSVEPKEARRGETVRLTITGTPKPGYHAYPVTRRTPEQEGRNLSRLRYEPSPGLQPLWPVAETDPVPATEGKNVYLEHKGPFTWSQDVLVLPGATPGPATFKALVDLQVCDENHCVPGKVPLEAKVLVSPQEAVPLTAELKKRREELPPAPQVISEEAAAEDSSLLGFVLAGVFWGFVSLITPCVFPMIPITVSFFLKQSEKEHHKPLTMAAVYCLTIVVVLTIAAVALLSVFRELSTNPYTNFVIGGLFIFFALSLFGMYEIELPSSLARFTSAREGRGGLLGTMFMALTFTIISFACVAPFLGGFGGTAANASLTWSHRLLGGLAFAATFASPFFILALFPALLRKLPKSGSWLNTVKVVMGFLELAASLKFLRAGELVKVSEPTFFTYDLVLGLYVALALLCGLYLLGLYRLPYDSPIENLGVPRMLLSLACLALAFYLVPGLFKYGEAGKSQRPSGAVFAWLDSFILPDESSDLPFVGNLEDGLAKAREKKNLVFVDFTGVTCNNCRLNERNVFSQPEVKDVLTQYTLVAMYTDKVPTRFYDEEERKNGVELARQQEDAEKNLQFQRKEFNTEQLPLYAILEPLPDGKYKILGKYDEGRINNQFAFLRFLRGRLKTSPTLIVEKGAGGVPPLAKADPSIPTDLGKGLKKGQEEKKLVFVDFTGVNCLNCRINEKTVFSRPEVRDLLGRYSLVALYTDEVPEKRYPEEERKAGVSAERRQKDAEVNQKFQGDRFGDNSLPLYVILEPLAQGGFKELRRCSGRITDPMEFIRFLEEPRAATGAARNEGSSKAGG